MNWTWDVYAICAVAGGLFFLVQLFTGIDDHDLSHDFGSHDLGSHDSPGDHDSEVKIFSLRTLLVAITFFGIGGKISQYYQLSFWLCILIAIASGLLAGYLAYLFMRALFSQQASSLINTNELVGLLGKVHITIIKDGIGEVCIETKGQRRYLTAKTKDGSACPADQTVKVTAVVANQLIVETA